MAKAGGGKAKGSDWERTIAKKLSLWWTKDDPKPNDFIFWRTSQSGGRATQREKSGEKTKGHYGDLTAVEMSGLPFMKLLVVECKKGYSSDTIHALLDKPEKAKEQTYESWIYKAQIDATAAGVPYWLLIAERNRREPLIFMPWGLVNFLESEDVLVMGKDYLELSIREMHIFGMTLENWFRDVSPTKWKEIDRK